MEKYAQILSGFRGVVMWKEKITKYQQAAAYMEAVRRGGIVPGLDSIRRLTAELGNPQDDLRFIHIAGTNGKGSVLAFVSRILQCAGYRTGRYLSPVVFSELEKLQINSRPISKADFTRGIEGVREAAERLEAAGFPYPTPFEVETALAFWYFREKGCDIVVLETGMGGLWDATNIIRRPVAAVFTSISMDHAGMLGNTLAEIAEQKAGIIKNECYVISTEQKPDVMEMIEKTCEEKMAKLSVSYRANIKSVRYGIEKQQFSYKEYKNLDISLTGMYQIENAALAVEVIRAVQKQGFVVTERVLRKGLWETKWPGRFSVISKHPLFIIDGAHNADAAQKLKESVIFYFTNKKIITIMGILRDKEYEKIAKITAPLASQIITVAAPGNPRAFPAYELAGVVKKYNPNVTAADSLQEAVEMSYLLAKRDSVILAFGSLSYLGELSKIAGNRAQIRRDTHGKSKND